ncbi:LacI family transcriptional regulator [Flavobacteriaceae bacterium]|jgi:LacI family transcriptional regulator|nr:LacI family transcriptional regulator [Flavobacteriaceae bacterium]
MKSKLTMKNLASELDVSVSTVSKALSDSKEISIETRERIKAFAKLYNYKPNSLALKFSSQKTYSIGVIIPEIVHHFFATVLRGIDEYANDKGYNVMVCFSNESYEKEISNVEMLLEGSVDGIIISISSETQQKNNYNHIKKLVQDKYPIVLFDRIVEEVDCDKIFINDEDSAYKATEYLIETGCKRIVIIKHAENVKIGTLRKNGYLKALAKYNIEVDESLIIEGDEDKNIEELLKDLFKDNNNYPDAILATNGEVYASVAMQMAKAKGLSIPEDISIITFVDGLISKYSSPPLTALWQHGFEMGKQAVELLVDRIEGNEDEYQIQKKVIPTKLKIRQSTREIKSKQ